MLEESTRPENKMNILQLYDKFMIGGAETHILSLSNGLAELGHKVVIASAPGSGVNSIINSGHTYVECPLHDPVEQMKAIKIVVNIIQEYQIDVIHAHPYNSQLVAVIAAKIMNVPVVTTIHGTYQTPANSEFVKSSMSAYIGISQEVVRYLSEAYLLEEASCIPNTVELPVLHSEEPIEQKILKLVYVSRVDVDKFQSILFVLMALPVLVSELNKRVELTIVGDGDRLEFVKEYGELLNKYLEHDCVKVVGASLNVNEYIKKSDAVIGVGRVVLEGIAQKKHTICIGNHFYPGLMDAEKLNSISKVNFTDRNSNVPLTVHNFLEDIKRIKTMKQQNDVQLIEENYALLTKCFSVQQSALAHQNVYYKARAADSRRLNVVDKQLASSYAVSSQVKYIIEHKYSRRVNAKKDFRVWISPEFGYGEDQWVKILGRIIDGFQKDSDFEVIFRIQNQYHEFSEKIIGILNKLFVTNKGSIPNFVIEKNQYTEEQELNMLFSVDAYIPTNSFLSDTLMICKAVGIDVMDVDSVIEKVRSIG